MLNEFIHNKLIEIFATPTFSNSIYGGIPVAAILGCTVQLKYSQCTYTHSHKCTNYLIYGSNYAIRLN